MARYVFWLTFLIVGACSSDDSAPTGPTAVPDTDFDAGGPDAKSDVGVDAADDVDAADAAAIPATYNDITDATKWETFDVFGNVPAAGAQYEGSTFDGRYVYFAPSGNGRVARYDTTMTAAGSFAQAAAWSAIDISTFNVNALGYAGGVFDGRYAYFIPSAWYTRLARYDTKADFSQAGSWSFADLQALDPLGNGYFLGGFDGRYLYLAPRRRANAAAHGRVARFDTQAADVGSPTSWTFFDISASVNAALINFGGAVFDGRYMYFVPFGEGAGHVVARYDTKAPFDQASSWTSFDIATVDVRCKGYVGAVFDGRHIYFAPWITGGGFVLARLDTQAPFAQASSWSTFETTKVDANAIGFEGARFDGRFVYFVPFGKDAGPGASGLVIRFDSTKTSLSDLSAWSKFDLTTKSPTAKAFAGGGFDGRHIYFAPEANGQATMARFDARSPPSLGTFTPSFH